MRICILVMALLLVSCSVQKEPSSPPLAADPRVAVLESYAILAHRMDSRVGLLRPEEAHQLWGKPDETAIDGLFLRVVWFQDRRPFPLLSPTPEPGTVAREVANLAASEGDGYEWPLTTRLVMWFSGDGIMRKWRLELQDGSIYQPSANIEVRGQLENHEQR